VDIGIGDGAERTVVLEGFSWTPRDIALAPDLTIAVCVSGPLASIRQRNVAPLA